MIEVDYSEINIEQLKESIRAAVAQREAEGRTQFVKASAELFELLSQQLAEPSFPSITTSGDEIEPLRLQPDFVPHADDQYQLSDLVQYHDAQFVWNAYCAILKREPDEPGLNNYLQTLRSGRLNKIDVLASLRFSPEGRRHNVNIEGLRYRAMFRFIYRVPVLGYLVELAAAVLRLPFLVGQQRALETYLIAQQERIAAHCNHQYQTISHRYQEIAAAISQLNQAVPKSISELSAEQRHFARVQHQQVSALFANSQNSEMNGRHQPANMGGQLQAILARLQEQLRGDFESVKESLRVYLPLLAEESIEDSILDLGCGRGEWLELLHENGRRARGVESNTAIIDSAQVHHLDIVKSDALTYLHGLKDESVKAITAFHFVEHLSLDELFELLKQTRRVLQPGALLIIETPNSKNLVVGACNFYSDPTHRHPLFPETLEFFVQQLGFRTRVQYLHPSEDSPFTGTDEASQALNNWLFGPRDYALIARKG